jgi:hypothetical protein
MAFQLSPGVLVQEQDLTAIVPSVASSAGAFAGAFQWGPVGEVTTIDSENNLVKYFGDPTDTNYASFYTAANFLAYGNNLKLVRVVNEGVAKNAIANTSATAVLIKNYDDYIATRGSGGYGLGEFAAKYAGNLGNSLKVSMVDGNTWNAYNGFVGNAWPFQSAFNSAPGTSINAGILGSANANDELHIIVIDEDGLWSGAKNTVLEKYAFVSKGSDAKKTDGSSNYYKDVLNTQSSYIWSLDHPLATKGNTSNWGSSIQIGMFGNLSSNISVSLNGGAGAESNISDGNVISAYSVFANDELYDVNLIPLGPWSNSSAIVNSVLAIAEDRKDCMVFISPGMNDVVNVSPSTQASGVVSFRNNTLNINSSYAVMDSGWKYQYDRYNDKYRWVPLNGDIAGLCARVDDIADPWFSPGGFNRGQIRNVVKLAFNPSKTDRDTLYKAGINPVVSFPGQGTVLFGDKTLLAKPSAFDRINVRRLFIILEKSIATASKFQLFEFNDPFTRAQFKNIVEPFLRDVQGRRGITDFKVVCDETNNDGDVIDRNEFRADIYIKPARSINFISLTFVATRSGISFSEIGA